MKLFYLLLSPLFLIINHSATDEIKDLGVRFDGIYQQDTFRLDAVDNEMRWYLRFFEDGKVVQKQTFVEPKIMIKNFVYGNDYVDQGTYTITGNKISIIFETGSSILSPKSHTGEGEILSNGKIKMKITVDGVTRERSYNFIKL